MSNQNLTRLAITATLHCLTGCAIGEVLGMVIGTALGWSDLGTIALAVGLAFLFGYSFTIRPVLRSGVPLRTAVKVALVADTVSIAVMEVVDNGVMLAIPGAMEAGLTSWVFWASLAGALAVAFVVTVPVNRALIARGRGHAVTHRYHAGHGQHAAHDAGHAHTDHGERAMHGADAGHAGHGQHAGHGEHAGHDVGHDRR
ncbi:DUF4396 domain-containing protein [Micromonospora sp. C28SCA-DRY-2]|uniref:DUF4396 domain-containing protein n=1 Tax=Micromonospora sp. C28SCA-DRY-2 TaxID=3059522 RepID=UPI002675021B|nr:DUF4396 domain-containing protein [Micromonospora sp. C28SCA-DRY-2]MDO3700818.1 DUF4396 domain-containing protein [Micromonospora sp. C28SCA-DRY-2]